MLKYVVILLVLCAIPAAMSYGQTPKVQYDAYAKYSWSSQYERGTPEYHRDMLAHGWTPERDVTGDIIAYRKQTWDVANNRPLNAAVDYPGLTLNMGGS